MEETIGVIEENVTDATVKEEVKKIKDKLKDGAKKCKKSMKVLSAGKLCYLVSGQASDKATWDGTTLSLGVKTDAVGAELN